MSEFSHDEPTVAQQVFEAHFRSLLDEPTYVRAKRIFDEAGVHNERSLATQLHTAHAFGKLEDVLAAYEQILDPIEGFLHLVPDEVARVVEVRRFGDVIYGSVIAEGNPMMLLRRRDEIDIPEIFDLMA